MRSAGSVAARRRIPALLLGVLLASCAQLPPPAEERVAAPSPTGEVLVAAAHPLAAEAGMAVLRRGGSAVDAAVAVQAVLGLVEPQSSGIGGGAFMLVYDAAAARVHAYDGRETAPSGASREMFLDEHGRPLPFAQAVVSGRAVGVPGVIAMLGLAHQAHGALEWSSLFDGAIRLAAAGFEVTPRLARFIGGSFPQNSQPDVRAYFGTADGTRLATGDVLRNPAYAETLRRIAQEGPGALYTGPIAEAVVARARTEPLPGTLAPGDLAAYRVEVREPLCRPYRIYVVCVPPPPSSGIAILQALGMLAALGPAPSGPGDADAWYRLAEVQRLMYADRDRYVGDPAFVDVPVEGLLDPDYLRSRAALVGPEAGPAPRPGSPPGAGERAPDRTREAAGTSHFVVVDAQGNAVSMTTSVESLFGSGRMAAGFFLNNQLTDFSFQPREPDGVPAANAVAPGKRPRSSMSPVIVLDRQNRLVAALGSPGGTNILAYNLKTLVAVLDWGLEMQAAIELPNVIGRGEGWYGEAAKLSAEIRQALAARGVEVRAGRGEGSGLHGVLWRNGRLDGGADPRREGVVLRASVP